MPIAQHPSVVSACERHPTATVAVTLIATEGKPLAGNFFADVTVMTLVTVDCRLFLDGGRPLYFVGLTPSTYLTNPTSRARSPVPMRSLRPLAVSGSSNLPDYPTPLPDEKDGPSSGW